MKSSMVVAARWLISGCVQTRAHDVSRDPTEHLANVEYGVEYDRGQYVAPYNSDLQGNYTPPPGVHDELVKNQDGTWKITTKDQTVLNFGTDGRMTSIVDRNGNAITLAYSDGDLVSVTSPTGQVITFGHDTINNHRRCTSVSGGTRTWTFEYPPAQGEDLVKIHYPMVGANDVIDGSSTAYRAGMAVGAAHQAALGGAIRSAAVTAARQGGGTVPLLGRLARVRVWVNKRTGMRGYQLEIGKKAIGRLEYGTLHKYSGSGWHVQLGSERGSPQYPWDLPFMDPYLPPLLLPPQSSNKETSAARTVPLPHPLAGQR